MAEPAAAPSPAPEATLKGVHFFAMKVTIEQLWGPSGVAEFAAKLGAEARAKTWDVPLFARSAVPTRFVLDWYRAVMDGPAKGDLAGFDAFTRGFIDEGFGRVKKLLLRMISIDMFLARCGEFWSGEHSVGTLTASRDGDGARFELRDHPYVEDELGCISTAEIYRHLCQIVSGKRATSRWEKQDGALVVTVRWSDG